MTTLASSRGWTRAAAASHPILFALLAMARRISRRMNIRDGRHRLEMLPDYLLADVGISRSEIDVVTEFGREDWWTALHRR